MDLKHTHIVLATHNTGKIPEISALVSPYGCTVATASDYTIDAPVEDGDTFCENALIKARHTAYGSGHIALADDSGLCVCALNDAPGVYSARYAGKAQDFTRAIDRIQSEMIQSGDTDIRAYFVCALAVVNPHTGEEHVFQGQCHGNWVYPPQGDKGFGYDPAFMPDGYDITFAQMEPSEKHVISHRAIAFAKMKEKCFGD